MFSRHLTEHGKGRQGKGFSCVSLNAIEDLLSTGELVNVKLRFYFSNQ